MLPLTCESIPFAPPHGWEALLHVATQQPFAAVFDSAAQGQLATRSFVSFAPIMLLQCTGQTATWQRGRNASRLEGNPLDVFERIERFTQQECPLREPAAGDGFFGGWAGLLGYDLRCYIEKLSPPKPDGPWFPDLQAGFYAWTLCYEHATDTCELRLLNGAPGGPEDIEKLAEDLTGLISTEREAGPSINHTEKNLLTDRGTWLRQVETVQRHIFEGDIYQANLTRMVRHTGDFGAPDLYGVLRSENPAPFGGYLDCGEGRAILSSSPERFLSVLERHIETRPIKGTRPRSLDPVEDEKLRQELLASEKDRAELTMIVDLERNDLGRVCKPGTVKVPSLLHAESYQSVHHLEATVCGELRDDITPVQYIRATFPGGSISGAPKKRALEIIHELEPVRRGPYTGSMFWLTPDGRFESNILIRTLLRDPMGVSYHVGCGIVADSDPAAEWDESEAKGAALASAIAKYAGSR